MPNLVYDTPTPPSQLYSSGVGISGAATLLRPRFQQQQQQQPVVTSTVLPKSRLREQYRPEMDYDLDGSSSSSDSTCSSSDLAVNHNNNNNSPRHKYGLRGAGGAATAGVDENRPPNSYYRSPGYGDAGMGLGMDDKQRFLDVQESSKQRGNYMSTRVDERSDASSDSRSNSTHAFSSDSEDDIAARGGMQSRPTAQPNKPLTAINNITSTPYPGPGVSSNNISKSAFDGMARELRKEFDRIMHAGQPSTENNNSSPSRILNNPSPPQFRSRRNSAIQRVSDTSSPSYVQGLPTPLPRGVLPKRPASAAATSAPTPAPPAPTAREHERTPTSQRTFGQAIRFPRQEASAAPTPYVQPKSPHRSNVTYQNPSHNNYQAASPFQTLPISGTIPPNNTRASNQPTYRAADSPGKVSNASSYNGVRVPDVTGLTEGLTSPSRVGSGPSSHREFLRADGSPVSSSRVYSRSQEDPALSSALSGLRRRLEALESENARSEAKVAELQDRLAAQGPSPPSGRSANPDLGDNPHHFVETLRDEINKLQAQIETHNQTLSQLQSQQPQAFSQTLYGDYNPQSWQNVFAGLREALQQLADQVMAVRQVLEEVLQSMKSNHLSDADLLRPQASTTRDRPLPAQRPLHTSGQYPATLSARQPPIRANDTRAPYNPLAAHDSPPQRSSSAPTTQARPAEYRVPRTVSNPGPERPASHNISLPPREPLLDRAERILSSVPPRLESHTHTTCDMCRRQLAGTDARLTTSLHPDDSHAGRHAVRQSAELPMQTVITRALKDLEDDFAVHKRIYVDLSEEFKLMDPATPEVNRRKILASHLKESVDILEMKADEIKRLYDLLHYRSELQSSTEYERMRTLARGMNNRYI
ncbi:hypothetical protein P389DRAFT_97911 [Cystobasidium minutum MCA 4210]|uniref:uncharacterized protein n=1 Tax=Cystobasidium minutum MCA 4210 TaxID=1397322 RepID=UPI0034CE5C8B|eukprot:jgi/Rhomi1/97911/CE97910_131